MISNLAQGRANNFNLIRIIAAAAVLLSHSWPIAMGGKADEPLEVLTGFTLGTNAVMVFFAISGFFITKSADRRKSTFDFVVARVLRLYPALIVALILTVLVVGPLFTDLTLWQYAGDARTWTYVPRNALLFRPQWALPGVFTTNISGNAINGSLWTLFWEVACYSLVLTAGVIGILRKDRFPILVLLFVILQIASRLNDEGADTDSFTLLSLPFFTGCLCYVYRASLPLSGCIVLALTILVLLVSTTAIYPVIYAVALSYGALWLGAIGRSWFRAYNRVGDYSYGMYIYAFPVQQMLVAAFPGTVPWLLAGLSLPLTLALAVLSWHVIEQPMLRQRYRIVHLWLRLTRRDTVKFSPPAAP